MSNDPTKDMGEKYGTKPTLETLLQMLIEMRNETRIGLAQIDGRLNQIDGRLKRVENKIGVLNEDVLAVRADVRELKMTLTVHEQG